MAKVENLFIPSHYPSSGNNAFIRGFVVPLSEKDLKFVGKELSDVPVLTIDTRKVVDASTATKTVIVASVGEDGSVLPFVSEGAANLVASAINSRRTSLLE